MKIISSFQRVALIAVLVLPALVYIIFVYGQNEVFFKTLEYVGEKVYDEAKEDTLYYEIPAFELLSNQNKRVTKESLDSTIYVVTFFFANCPSICPASR